MWSGGTMFVVCGCAWGIHATIRGVKIHRELRIIIV